MNSFRPTAIMEHATRVLGSVSYSGVVQVENQTPTVSRHLTSTAVNMVTVVTTGLPADMYHVLESEYYCLYVA